MVGNFYNSPLPGPLLGDFLAKSVLRRMVLRTLLTLASRLPSPPRVFLGSRSRVTSHTRRTETSPGRGKRSVSAPTFRILYETVATFRHKPSEKVNFTMKVRRIIGRDFYPAGPCHLSKPEEGDMV